MGTKEQVIARFPATFGLRAFPGKTFRISAQASYVNDSGTLQLYTQVLRDGQWLDFAKDSEKELRAELVDLKGLAKVVAVLGKPYPGQPNSREVSYVGTFNDGSSRTIRKSWNVYHGVWERGGGKFSFSRARNYPFVIEWNDEWVDGRWVKKAVSFNVEASDGSGFAANGLFFATRDEAEAYAADLFRRWTACRETRVVQTSRPYNYIWDTTHGLVPASKVK